MKHYFDRIYCINLKRRTDRWEESLKEFEKLDIADDVIRFEAIDIQPGIIGCTKSHYEIIKIAEQDKCENILVFEDDLELTKHPSVAKEIISNSMEQLLRYYNAYDMLYLGGNVPEDKSLFKRIDENLSQISICKTTHAYVISNYAFKPFLNHFDNIDWEDSWNWSQSNEQRCNIDKWYINNIHSKGRTFGVYPCLFNQRSNHSDLLHRNSDFVFSEKWDRILA